MSDLPNAFGDDDEMPFGKHKGAKLSDVPTSYLLWLWDEGLYSESNVRTSRYPLHAYIYNSFSALEQDAPNYIVKHPRK